VVPTYGKQIIEEKHMANNTIIILQHSCINRPGSETDHSAASGAEVKMRSAIPVSSPTCLEQNFVV
jgi:hypothetical protein